MTLEEFNRLARIGIHGAKDQRMAKESVEVLDAFAIKGRIASALFVTFEINREVAKQTKAIEKLNFVRRGMIEEPKDTHVELNYAKR